MSQTTTFDKVWFLSGNKSWRRWWNLLAYQDIGVLTVSDNHIEFVGRRNRASIDSIHQLGFGTQGRDFVNNWVQIDTGERTVFFADGRWWGFRCRTRQILRAIVEAFPEAEAKPSATLDR